MGENGFLLGGRYGTSKWTSTNSWLVNSTLKVVGIVERIDFNGYSQGSRVNM